MTAQVVVRLRAPDGPDVTTAQIAFHLLAGAARIVVEPGAGSELGGDLRAACGDDTRVTIVERVDDPRLLDQISSEWVIDARSGEFWWPRAGSIPAVLGAIPARYHTVHALVRPLVVAAHDHGDAVAHAVARDLRPASQPPVRVRPLHRTAMARWLIAPDGVRPGDPLRGWYPFEVLTLPGPGTEMPNAATLADGIDDGSLKEDTRLRDVLEPLRAGTGAFRLLPEDERTELPAPSLADEAEYAVEVASIGESEPEAVKQQIAELERRMAALEATPWRRVSSRLARIRAVDS